MVHERFARAARLIVAGAASFYTTLTALLLIGVWLAWGPFVGFSDGWQLIANTTTTLVTNLLAFLILNAQSQDTREVNKKLDHIITKLERDDAKER